MIVRSARCGAVDFHVERAAGGKGVTAVHAQNPRRGARGHVADHGKLPDGHVGRGGICIADGAVTDDLQCVRVGRVNRRGEGHIPCGGVAHHDLVRGGDVVQFGVGQHELAGAARGAQIEGAARGGSRELDGTGCRVDRAVDLCIGGGDRDVTVCRDDAARLGVAKLKEGIAANARHTSHGQ